MSHCHASNILFVSSTAFDWPVLWALACRVRTISCAKMGIVLKEIPGAHCNQRFSLLKIGSVVECRGAGYGKICSK